MLLRIGNASIVQGPGAFIVRALIWAATLLPLTSASAAHAATDKNFTSSKQRPFDGGGIVRDYMKLVATANIRADRMELRGTCASACTLKLAIKHVCVQPDAELWFHAVTDNWGNIMPAGETLLLSYYPPGIRAWALANHALEKREFSILKGRAAIAMGARACHRFGKTAAS